MLVRADEQRYDPHGYLVRHSKSNSYRSFEFSKHRESKTNDGHQQDCANLNADFMLVMTNNRDEGNTK